LSDLETAIKVPLELGDLEGLTERLEKMKFPFDDMNLNLKLEQPFQFDLDLKGLIDGDAIAAAKLSALDAARDNAFQFSDDVRQRVEESRQRMEESRLRMQEAQQRVEEIKRDQDTRIVTPRVVIAGVPGGGGDNAYNNALSLLNSRRYDMAIQMFDRVIARKESRADGAMYHKAWALSRSGRTQDALETIAALRRDYPQSRYLPDAKVLEADVKRMAGQPINPAAADDDEIKLLAINGLQKSEQAIPLLEGVLASANSLSLKKRALFVLAANDDPRARAILLRQAKGDGNPDLQAEAIRLLVSRGDGQTTGRELREIYEGTQDAAVRMQIIDAYRSSSDKAALIAIASNKSVNTDLRGRAVRNLSELASADELWTLYQQETDAALRSQMVSAFGSMHALDQLTRVARTDADAGVRRRAISNIGGQRGDLAAKSRQTLLDLYGSQTDNSVKTSIINAFNTPESADALVALARKETTLELKRAIVQRLSDLAPRSKVAADYLMEVIK